MPTDRFRKARENQTWQRRTREAQEAPGADQRAFITSDLPGRPRLKCQRCLTLIEPDTVAVMVVIGGLKSYQHADVAKCHEAFKIRRGKRCG